MEKVFGYFLVVLGGLALVSCLGEWDNYAFVGAVLYLVAGAIIIKHNK